MWVNREKCAEWPCVYTAFAHHIPASTLICICFSSLPFPLFAFECLSGERLSVIVNYSHIGIHSSCKTCKSSAAHNRRASTEREREALAKKGAKKCVWCDVRGEELTDKRAAVNETNWGWVVIRAHRSSSRLEYEIWYAPEQGLAASSAVRRPEGNALLHFFGHRRASYAWNKLIRLFLIFL